MLLVVVASVANLSDRPIERLQLLARCDVSGLDSDGRLFATVGYSSCTSITQSGLSHICSLKILEHTLPTFVEKRAILFSEYVWAYLFSNGPPC
jgi:hypothetical protein